MNKTFSIIYSTRKIDQYYIDLLKTTSGVKDVEVITFENPNGESLTDLYNQGLIKTKNDIVEHDHPPPPEQNPVQSFVGDVSGGVYANADDLPVKTANTDVSDWVAQPDGQTEYQVPRGMSSNAMDGFYTEGGEVDINMWSAYSHDNSSWVGYTSADGAVYYYNTQTGESSWDKPPGVPPIDNGGGARLF